jgi:hypothetical protein
MPKFIFIHIGWRWELIVSLLIVGCTALLAWVVVMGISKI